MTKVNIIVKTDTKFLKYRNVTNLEKMIRYLNDRYNWYYVNIYDSKTKEQTGSITKKQFKN